MINEKLKKKAGISTHREQIIDVYTVLLHDYFEFIKGTGKKTFTQSELTHKVFLQTGHNISYDRYNRFLKRSTQMYSWLTRKKIDNKYVYTFIQIT